MGRVLTFCAGRARAIAGVLLIFLANLLDDSPRAKSFLHGVYRVARDGVVGDDWGSGCDFDREAQAQEIWSTRFCDLRVYKNLSYHSYIVIHV